ncbi:MAG: hypothetical protein K8R91_02065 [Phycisphaerae bacterium]|nr:hypothetical protein [Phycisphaerae bacterium]
MDNPHNPDWPSFPLPDIYNDDDSLLPGAALSAIRRWRRNYIPEIGSNGEQLKAAVEVALAIQSAWSNNDLVLRKVPLAENLNWPVERDFLELEQWFTDADAAIAKEIDSGSGSAKAAAGEADLETRATPRGWVKRFIERAYYITIKAAVDSFLDFFKGSRGHP